MQLIRWVCLRRLNLHYPVWFQLPYPFQPSIFYKSYKQRLYTSYQKLHNLYQKLHSLLHTFFRKFYLALEFSYFSSELIYFILYKIWLYWNWKPYRHSINENYYISSYYYLTPFRYLSNLKKIYSISPKMYMNYKNYLWRSFWLDNIFYKGNSAWRWALMLPIRRIRDKVLKSLVRVKYDFGDGKDLKRRCWACLQSWVRDGLS